MDIRGKKVLVVGLGKTGVKTVRFLVRKEACVRASDILPLEKLPDEVRELKRDGVYIETGKHSRESFLWADTIILSPGVPFGLPLVEEAIRNGVEVISDGEFAFIYVKKPIIGITGSNGKTTTSTLVARILEASGKRVFLGANIGTPLIQIAEQDEDFDVLVLELSSFQLQGTVTFKPFIGVILNISPNHLDHHAGFGEYMESKFKLFANQTEDDWSVYNFDNFYVRNYMPEIKSRKLPFGFTSTDKGVFFDGTFVRFGEEVYDLREMKLVGAHNLENAMAAIASTRIMGCDPEVIRREIVGFSPLPHRIEFVGEFNGVRFFNDSKATSPGATLRALQSFCGSVILIAGGKDKGVDYSCLRDEVARKVKVLILIGESMFQMQKELGDRVKTHLASSLEEAIEMAISNASKGDTVLFSPACSSFDMFSSYEERGRRFKEGVWKYRKQS